MGKAAVAAYLSNTKRRRRRAGGGWFSPDDWSVADLSTGGDISITLHRIPGGVLTDVEFDVNGDEDWSTIGGFVAGTYPIANFTDDAEVLIRIRSVDAAGDGMPSRPKAVTPTA